MAVFLLDRGLWTSVSGAAALTAALGPEQAAARAGLVSAQLLGLALTRHLLRLPAVAHLAPDEIVSTLAPAVRATLGQH
ncbi:TetR/AcrR family transcriptional regulator [Streptomyces avermitilis]